MKNLKLILVTLLIAALTIPDAHAGDRIKRNLVAYIGAGTVSATGRDTTTNADTSYLYLGASSGSTIGTTLANNDGSLAYGCDVIYEWSAVPSISGTTVGTIYIQGSNTGTFAAYTTALTSQDWVALTADVTQFGGGYNSVSVTSTVKKGYFSILNCQFKYVRLVYITSGTQTSVVTGTAIITVR